MSVEITFKSESDVELIQSMGCDSIIAKAARVSTRGQTADTIPESEVSGLLRYLMQHRHGTPFEAGAMTFFIRAPIFVWREFHRHRIGFSFNEESARYKTLDPVFYLPRSDRPMMKVDGWKPGRPKFTESPKLVHAQLCENLRTSYLCGYNNYLNNLQMGIDPGLARDCLPVGIYSSCWVTCNPRSLMHFLSLRTHRPLSLRTHRPDAQKVSYPLWEIEQVANQLEARFAELFPITHSAFNDFGRTAP